MARSHTFRVPLTLDPQPEGGFTVTSTALPELITQGDTLEEALANAKEAFACVMDAYRGDDRPLPSNIIQVTEDTRIETEQLLAAAS